MSTCVMSFTNKIVTIEQGRTQDLPKGGTMEIFSNAWKEAGIENVTVPGVNF